jgi:exonuclease III
MQGWQHKGRWYAWLPEHDHLWELMREQAVIVGDFQGRVPDSDAHSARARARTHSHEHLNTNNEHVKLSDAHLDVSGASLTDQAYFDLLAAEVGG